MDTSLKDIITEIGKKYGFEDEKIDSYIKTLRNEFYVLLNDIKNMSENDWNTLKLPKNLYNLIKEKYESALNDENKNQSFFSHSLNDIGLDLSAPIIQLVNNKKKEEIIFDDLSLLFQQVNDDKMISKIFKNIYKVINNIIQNPNNEIYKRFNIDTILKHFNFPEIETFFSDINFKRKDEYMFFIGTNEYIKSVELEFIKFIKDKKINDIIDNKIDTKPENILDNKVDNKAISNIDNDKNKFSPEKNINNSLIPTNKVNKPLKGSQIKDDSSNIKLYLYPKINFSSKEEDNSKVILLIGQTGEGKSTFINALVNIYSGIKIDDNFRYLLVYDEDNSDQRISKTKNVTVYNIRPKKELNYPPLKIVDTPGFGDTGGINEDQNHLKKLKEVFDKQIVKVHSICFMVNSSRCRIDFHQEYVFNTLMGLFAENVKNIFIVGVTNFFSTNEKKKPDIIKKSLSHKDSFYYKCILEGVKTLDSYWYFACDNEIITDNEIEGNNLEKDKWNKTEKTIKYYIENKIKDSKEIIIKETKEVLEKRINVTVEIDVLEKKIKELFDMRKMNIDDKKKEEINLKKIIREKEEIILEHQKKKEELEKNMENIQVMMENLHDEGELNFFAKKFSSESEYIDMIDNVKDSLKNKLNSLKEEQLRISRNIKEYDKKIQLNEIEIIQTLHQLKFCLDYLRKNSLNKDYSKSMESYITELIKETTDVEKKKYLETLRIIYSQLIEIENIDIQQLTEGKYQEIKDKIMNSIN